MHHGNTLRRLKMALGMGALCLAAFASSVSTARASNAVEILMLTWRGETAAEQGFREGLSANDINANITVFDAQRDRAAMAKFLRDNKGEIQGYDVVYTFGTTVSQMVHSTNTGTVPHVFNIVSDPVSAGLVQSPEAPGLGASGTSHAVSLELVFSTVDRVKPFSSIAILFDPREDNTVAQKDAAEKVLKSLGKSVKSIRIVPDANNFAGQLDSMRDDLAGVDVVFVPPASSFVENAEALFSSIPEGVISVGAIGGYVPAGAHLSVGSDYFNRGEVTARTVAQILSGSDASQIPVNEVLAQDAILFVNQSREEELDADVQSLGMNIEYK